MSNPPSLQEMKIPLTSPPDAPGWAGSIVATTAIAWTLACHITVFTGGTLNRAVGVFVLLGGLLALARFTVAATRRQENDSLQVEVATPDSSTGRRFLLWTLVVAAMVLTLIAHRPDGDDCQWVSWATAALDEPAMPILSVNTMNAKPWTPLAPFGYRFHSFEMAAAAVSKLISVEPIAVLHLLFAPLAAAMAVLVSRRLLARLCPHHWAPALLAWFVFLCADGPHHRSWGNFSFVRLYQAKAVLVTVILPWILLAGLRWADRPTVRRWLVLAGAQIVALGANFTSIFVAPVVAVLAVLAGLPKGARAARLRLVVVGATASFYPVAAGLIIRFGAGDTDNFLPQVRAGDVGIRNYWDFGVTLVSNALRPLGGGAPLVLAIAVVCLAGLVAPTRVARRVCVIFPLGALLFLNPLTAVPFTLKVTGTQVYWRVLWILPLPIMAAMVMTAPLTRVSERVPRWGRLGLFGLVLMAVVAAGGGTIFRAENGTRLGVPALKVPTGRSVAAAIVDLTRRSSAQRAVVVGPDRVTLWLPTFRHHPLPLLARSTYHFTLGDDRTLRRRLKKFFNGAKIPGDGPRILRRAIRTDHISCVCLPSTHREARAIRRVLADEGFTMKVREHQYEVWIAEQPRRSAADRAGRRRRAPGGSEPAPDPGAADGGPHGVR